MGSKCLCFVYVVIYRLISYTEKKNAPQPVYNNAILSPKAPLANDFGGSPRTSNKHPTIASETRNRTPPNRDSFDELMVCGILFRLDPA